MKDDIDILNYIPYGHENAVTRAELCERTGLSDRLVRRHIEVARIEGHPIINLQDGKGYYRATTREDVMAQININRSRALNVLAQNMMLDRALRNDGQMTLEEACHA